MARVIADLLDGEFRLSRDGDTARRVFHVAELSGAAEGRLHAATQAAGIPRVGDTHPAHPGLSVLDVAARPGGDPTMALVDVQYGIPSGLAGGAGGLGDVDVSIQSDLVTRETIRDINGNFIRTAYVYTVRYDSSTGVQYLDATLAPASIANSVMPSRSRVLPLVRAVTISLSALLPAITASLRPCST